MIAIAWILFVVLILIGLPVAFALGGSSVIMLTMGATNTAMSIVQKMAVGVDNFTLLAIPFFMMAGSLMNNIGIGDRIFDRQSFFFFSGAFIIRSVCIVL